MSIKKIICLGLFLLPLLGMIAILINYNSPVSSTIVHKDGSITQATTQNSNGSKSGNLDGEAGMQNADNSTDTDGTISRDDDGVWITKKVNNVTSTYKLGRTFGNCNVSENVANTLKDGNIVAPLAQINRIDFLEILLDTHCIDYTVADITGLTFDDISKNDIKTSQIVKTAIALELARGYDEGGKRVFRPNKKISKIEALAILMNLSGLQLKDVAPENNFADVEDNWKSNVADTSYRLGLTPIDTAKNLFFPEYTMKKGDVYDIVAKVAKYY